MTGEERSQRIRDDLLQARLIAASIQDRRGRPRKDHPLFSDPDEIEWRNGGPVFCYESEGFRIRGTPKRPLLVHAEVRGPITWRRLYDPLGKRVLREGFPIGKAEWN